MLGKSAQVKSSKLSVNITSQLELTSSSFCRGEALANPNHVYVVTSLNKLSEGVTEQPVLARR